MPSAIQPIQNVNITEEGNVTLSCNVSGIPSSMVSWIKVVGGERFDESDLVFTNISRTQAGEYRCEASNQCGNASETATIEVQCKYQLTVSLCFECNQLSEGCFSLMKLSFSNRGGGCEMIKFCIQYFGK